MNSEIQTISALAEAALARLRDSSSAAVALPQAAGEDVQITYSGPAMPHTIPASIASHDLVLAQDPGWAGAYRLTVRSPLVVFDLNWNADEPVRIMGFSRGDWERTLVPDEAVLGPEHPNTATSLNNLSFLLRAQGDLAGAKPYYERALAIREAALGPDHPNTRTVRDHLASLETTD